MQTVHALLPIWFSVCALLGASFASAQDSDTTLDIMGVRQIERADIVAADSPVGSDYKKNRLAFFEQRVAISTEAERIDEEILRRQRELEALARKKSELLLASVETPADQAGVLHSSTRRAEAAVVTVLSPLTRYLSELIGRRAESASSASTADRFVGNKGYVNLVLPLLVLLTLLVIRHKYRLFYARQRRYLKPLAIFLIIIFPASSFAQEQETGPDGQEQFSDMLVEADEVLRLSRVQRYIKLLSAGTAEGRRVRISGVDFGNVPIKHFESFVVGAGEYHATLAALYLADDNEGAAIEQLRPLAFSETRYASKNADRAAFEALLYSSAAYLLRSDEPQLAREIVQLHMGELRSSSSFESLYPELLRNAYDSTARDYADLVVAQSSDASALIGYARILLRNGSVVEATVSLNKALGIAQSADALAEIIEIGLSQEAAQIVTDAIAKVRTLVVDPTAVFAIAEKLRVGGRGADSVQILETAIDRASTQATNIVGGKLLSSTEALKYISYESFQRDFLEVAEKAALAAIKPLSSAERRALLMPVPAGKVDRLRVPEPGKLVAPLYFGLLYEQQGRAEAAKKRFITEGRRVIKSLVNSDGLYVPEMINHLTLLGSVLNEQEDAAELARLDTVLKHLESQSLEELRLSNTEAVESRRAELNQLDTQVLAAQTELASLQENRHTDNTGGASETVSALLLLLRNLSLVTVLLLYLAGAVAIALNFGLKRSAQRTSACWWKFVETFGWVWVLSIVSAPLGFGAIVIAQYFLLNQSRYEDWLRLSQNTEEDSVDNAGTAFADFNAGDLSETNQRQGAADLARQSFTGQSVGQSAGQSTSAAEKDRQWENVVQMLRETRESEKR